VFDCRGGKRLEKSAKKKGREKESVKSSLTIEPGTRYEEKETGNVIWELVDKRKERGKKVIQEQGFCRKL